MSYFFASVMVYGVCIKNLNVGLQVEEGSSTEKHS